ncbi:MAG: EpsI family protein [Longimicrobiales bacterium]|nr:EpsI family protein [Longimicrobiales bacterium]
MSTPRPGTWWRCWWSGWRGAAYAHLFTRGWRVAAAVVLLAGGMAVLANWIRVVFLVVLGEVTRMQSPIIADHGWVGWVVFSIGLVPFFLLARRAESWGAPARDASPPVRTEGGAKPLWLASATGLALVGPLLYHLLAALPSVPMPSAALAPAGEGWREVQHGSPAAVVTPGAPALPAAVVDWDVGYPEPDHLEAGVWVRDAMAVAGERRVYTHQRQGAELVNGMNRIAPADRLLRERTVGPVTPRGRMVREAWVGNPEGGGVTLVWYWYRVGGGETASPARAKLLEFLGFLTRRRAAELVMVAAPCTAEGCEAAARTLFDFVQSQPASPPEA